VKSIKSPWRLALEKRARKQVKLVQMAQTRLVGKTFNESQLPPHRVLGIHLGLLALAHSSPEVTDIRERAQWILHWMFGYMLEQGYVLEDVATDNGLAALEAVAVVAGTAKKAREKQPKLTAGIVYAPDGIALDAAWQEVYQSARKFISALDGLAR
jgi:hypothetical protein